VTPAAPVLLTIAERGIGDGLTLLPSLRALRSARPELSMELLAPGLTPLAENLRDTATVLDHRPFEDWSAADRLAWLRDRQPQWVWNTEGERGPWTAALRGNGNSLWVNAPDQRHWGSRNVLAVRSGQLRELFPELPATSAPELSLTPSQETMCRAFRETLPRESVLIAIQPGAGDPRRVWPAEKFRALALALTERAGVTVLLFLSDAESRFAEPGYLPERPNLRLVRAPLDDVVPRLAACDLSIGNDSGFYHLAFALGVKVVGIHRSLRGARRWSYRSPRSRVVISWMPRQLDRDWARWVSVRRVLRAAERLLPF
jgi:ADP-heptose:LPS heptosyltransferase